MIDAQTKKIIDDLKKVQKEKKIPYEEIVRRTEANGERVSLSSVKNVFKENPEHNHSYEHTIKPIARALESEDKLNGDSDYQLIAARLEFKDSIIKQQEEVIKELKERLKRKDERHQEILELYKSQIVDYKEQISDYKEQMKIKDNQIVRYEKNIDRKDAALRKHFIDIDDE